MRFKRRMEHVHYVIMTHTARKCLTIAQKKNTTISYPRVFFFFFVVAFRSSATSGGHSSGRPKTSVDSSGGGCGRTDDDELVATAASSCWALSPGEAWAGSDQSVFVPRPLSAGPFHRPTLRTEFISSDANLSPQDPAVPLIKAIRKELDKFPPSPDPCAADSSR